MSPGRQAVECDQRELIMGMGKSDIHSNIIEILKIKQGRAYKHKYERHTNIKNERNA
jgi:hypothetical protein